jgi:hypothetical protein
MNENNNPNHSKQPSDELESLMPGLDDDWSVFAVDIVPSEEAKLKGEVALWAGTNSPIINEILSQKVKENAYPYEPAQLGLIPAGHSGLYFKMSQANFNNKEELEQIIKILSKEAETIAKEQGYSIQSLGDMTKQKGIIQHVLRLTADIRKLGSPAIGLDYDDEEFDDEIEVE